MTTDQESELNQEIIDFLKKNGPVRRRDIINKLCGKDALRWNLQRRLSALLKCGVTVKVKPFIIGLAEGW